jgi:hypothetical protein
MDPITNPHMGDVKIYIADLLSEPDSLPPELRARIRPLLKAGSNTSVCMDMVEQLYTLAMGPELVAAANASALEADPEAELQPVPAAASTAALTALVAFATVIENGGYGAPSDRAAAIAATARQKLGLGTGPAVPAEAKAAPELTAL